jgi:ribose-phosphate pyrophosphokinase
MAPAPLILARAGDAAAAAIARAAGADLATCAVRRFPDGELHLRLDAEVAGREVWVTGSLHPADDALLLAYFIGTAARDHGAARVGLCAPYLAYMRQDAGFRPGEAVTSVHVARLLALAFDRLVTVDPHLHRYGALDELYPFPTRLVAAAPKIAAHIAARVERPLIVGPDAESEQWVGAVAGVLGCEHVVLEKTRRGDRDVSVSTLPRSIDWRGVTPVVVDDIVSTGRTMIETVRELARAGAAAPLCIGIHAVLAGSAEADVRAAGARGFASCNTIAHATNEIDVLDLVGHALVAPW